MNIAQNPATQYLINESLENLGFGEPTVLNFNIRSCLKVKMMT